MAGFSFFLICAVIGLFAGVMAGLLGVGGGVIMVPAFTRFLGMDIRMAIGTSMVIIVLTALVAGTKHYQLGHVDFRIVFIVAGLSMIGGYAGASLTQQFSVHTLQMVFAVFVLIVGVDMFVKAWQATPEPPPPSISDTSP